MQKRPTFVLRFRTKKQAADMKRAAKSERYTLNEYIIRRLETSMPQPLNPEYLRAIQDNQTTVDN